MYFFFVGSCLDIFNYISLFIKGKQKFIGRKEDGRKRGRMGGESEEGGDVLAPLWR